MPTLHLRIAPQLWGPFSVGTVDIALLLRDSLALSLRDAKHFVDRCVFENETVAIPVASLAAAESLARKIQALPGPATFHVRVEPDAT